MIHAIIVYPAAVDGPGGRKWRTQPNAVHLAYGRLRAQHIGGKRWLVAARRLEDLEDLVTHGARLITAELAKYEDGSAEWAVISGGSQPVELGQKDIVEMRRKSKGLEKKFRKDVSLPEMTADIAGAQK